MPELTHREDTAAEVPAVCTEIESYTFPTATSGQRAEIRERGHQTDPSDAETGCLSSESASEAEALELSVRALRALAVCEPEIERHIDALGLIRTWLGRPLWEMTASDADIYFGEYAQCQPVARRVDQARALSRYFLCLAGEHGAVLLARLGLGPARCPLDALNWPIPTPGHARFGPLWRSR